MPRMRATFIISLLASLALAASAHAESRTVDCLNSSGDPDSSELQAALDQATTGDTITVAANATCHTPFDEGGFRMPDGERITLRGLSGATLDGNTEETGVRDRILQGGDVNGSLITGLTFRQGEANDNGGAIYINGGDPVAIEDNVFRDNSADDGGAVYLSVFGSSDARQVGTDRISIRDNTFGVSDEGNVAGVFGGGLDVISQTLPVDLSGNTFRNNQAGEGAGGALLNVCAAGSTIDGNRFEDNLAGPAEGSPTGGGLLFSRGFCEQSQATFDATQSGNTFVGNRLDAATRDASGGGEAIGGASIQSTADRFVGNRIENSDSAADDEGAGVSVLALAGQTFEARNLVASGNAIANGGEGGGVYFGQSGGTLRLLDSTLVGNSSRHGAGITGGCSDRLKLFNSIVAGNGTSDQINGFDESECQLELTRAEGDQMDVRASDACADTADGPQPFPGDPSNFCADPKLAADGVHETGASPTVDAGSNSLVPSDLAKDFEGNARISGRAVDMGADEVVPATQPSPTPTSGGQPASQPSGGAVLGTTQKRCVSRRGFRIHIRVPHGKKALSATVRVNGKRVKVVRGKRLTAPVRLRGLPKGTFKVKITVLLRGGKRVSGTRRYHTCRPALPDNGPPPV